MNLPSDSKGAVQRCGSPDEAASQHETKNFPVPLTRKSARETFLIFLEI